MFILRRITSESKRVNTVLGNHYALILEEKNKEEYQKALKVMKWDNDPDVYGFISCYESKELIPLYKKSTYFVMVSDGKTFENITFK